MKNSYKYFKNQSCEYMPCHKGMDGKDFNCLFCYCPMNRYDDCLGTPQYITMENGSNIKDCSNCVFPHKAENYDKIIKFLSHKAKSINEK